MRSNALLVGVLWGLLELSVLVIGVEVGITFGNGYFARTGQDLGLQLIILLVLAISLGIGFYLKEIETSIKALLLAQLVAFLFFSLILPYPKSNLGSSLSDPMSDQFGLALVFLIGIVFATFIVGLVGSIIGAFLGEWNARRTAARH